MSRKSSTRTVYCRSVGPTTTTLVHEIGKYRVGWYRLTIVAAVAVLLLLFLQCHRSRPVQPSMQLHYQKDPPTRSYNHYNNYPSQQRQHHQHARKYHVVLCRQRQPFTTIATLPVLVVATLMEAMVRFPIL